MVEYFATTKSTKVTNSGITIRAKNEFPLESFTVNIRVPIFEGTSGPSGQIPVCVNLRLIQLMKRILIQLIFLVVIAWRCDASAAQLSLTWDDNSKDEEGFRIERKKGEQGRFEEIASVGPNVASYTDASASVGTTYCYRVRAFNSVGNSEYTEEFCAIIEPQKPSNSKTIIESKSTLPKEVANGIAIVKTSSGGSLSLFTRRPNTSILSVDGKIIAKSNLVEVSAGPHVIGIECIGAPRRFSSRRITDTFNYMLEARGDHTYQIKAVLVGGMCKLLIKETSHKKPSPEDN